MPGIGEGAIGDSVVKPGFAVEVVGGGEGDHTGSQGNCAVGGIGDRCQGEGIAIDIGVIGKQSADQDVNGSVLSRGGSIINGNRGIIDRSDGDGCRAGYSTNIVRNGEGEGIRSEPISCRCVGKCPVQVDGYCSVCGGSSHNIGQGIPFIISCGEGAIQRRILTSCKCIGTGYWGIIDENCPAATPSIPFIV